MGRRKSKMKPPAKNKAIEPLDTQFNCPICTHETSCEVKMGKGRRVCLEYFQTQINFLSEAIDVYHDWIVACETGN